jgi:hypothetical protein
MTTERRRHLRVTQPFDGSWRGASGATKCRIADISLGGCFVQSLAMPTPGENTVVSVAIGADHSLTFTGRVVYVDPGIGFAVQFNEIGQTHIDELHRLFDVLQPKSAAANS